MPEATKSRTIYTLGYMAGWTPQQVLAACERYEALLVDIRFKPTSRDPRWRQPALQNVLGERYRHVQALGNENFKGGPIQLHRPEAGIDTLRGLVTTHSVILMCMCGQVERCHRTPAAVMAGDALQLPVQHLLSPADAGV